MPDRPRQPALFPRLLGASFAALHAASWWGRVAPVPAALAAGLHRLGVACQRFGPRGSGMFVDLAGPAHDGRPLRLRWELVADGDEGRHIPCMGAVALVRKALRGGLPAAGALPCVGLLDLREYLAELEGLPVRTAVRRG